MAQRRAVTRVADLLLDTNIISFAIKGDTRADLYDRHLAGQVTLISFVTVAELYSWAVSAKWGERRVGALRYEIARHVVVPFDDELAWTWARVRNTKGFPVDPTDAWIAATALVYDLPLVTHNRRHFDGIPGLRVISEQ